MNNSIIVDGEKYEFSPINLVRGERKLNKIACEENLKIFKKVMDANGIKFGLIYGTLLGAVRENDFISWDEDVDVFVLEEDKDVLHRSFRDLAAAGLALVRADHEMYSVMRGSDYIDIYMFKKVGNKRACDQDIVDAKFLIYDEIINFKGADFYVPKRRIKFLETVYGKDWRTPKIDSPAKPWSFYRRLKYNTKKKFPFVLKIKNFLLT